MLDQAASAQRSHRLRWRERALRETRRRLQHLQVEMHRVKADLARLESANETDLANELAVDLGLELAEPKFKPRQLEVESRPERKAVRVDLSPPRRRAPLDQAAPQLSNGNSKSVGARSRSASKHPDVKLRKRTTRPWLLSLGAHGLVILLLAPLSYAMLANERTPLMASMSGSDTLRIEETGIAPIELVSFETFEMPDDVDAAIAELPQSELDSLAPIASEFDEATTAAQVGQLNSLPTDIGTLMAGGMAAGDGRIAAGGKGRGSNGDEKRLGMTNFFGTPARANRVVFLVDNSGSMKQGRMETTLLELVRSVESLGDKQEFYVVFYSDQAYPLFYPHSEMKAVAATRENKERLYRWLHTIELCTGGALLKAVEMAESLEPQVVYVLSDGNITSRRTLEQLTQPGARKFALHTLGMGVAKPQDAQNLAAIAAAHRGTFQMVRPLPAAVQIAKSRPIRSNPFGVSWGEGRLQP
jgi:hypothetical protein